MALPQRLLLSRQTSKQLLVDDVLTPMLFAYLRYRPR